MSKSGDQMFTVIGFHEDNGQIVCHHVAANSGSGAFAVCAEEHPGMTMVASLIGAHGESSGLDFPGSGLVDAYTVKEQGDVFSNKKEALPFTVIGRIYETDDAEVVNVTAKDIDGAVEAFVKAAADAYDCTPKQMKARGYDIYAVFPGHQQNILHSQEVERDAPAAPAP